MNKTELIDAIATRSNTSKAQTATMLNGLIDVVQKELAGGNSVQLIGFGTFSVTKRAAREGRNPVNGSPMKIPAKKIVKFKVGKALADSTASGKMPRAAKVAKLVKKTVKNK